MHFNSKKSCEARAEIGLSRSVAASSPPPVKLPRPSGLRDLPSPSPVVGAAAGQPFPLGVTPGKLIRPRGLSDQERLRIYQDAYRPAPPLSPPPTWMQIGVSVLAVVMLVLFLFALDRGQIPGVRIL